MELHLVADEVEQIILSWAAKEMPGKFNTLIFKSYGNDVSLLYVEPKKEDEKGGANGTEKQI